MTPVFSLATEEQSNVDSELAIGALTPVLEALEGLNRMVNLRTSIVENLDRIDVPPELETSHEELVAGG